MSLRFFSVGCSIRVLERASECTVGGREPEVIAVPDSMKGRVFIVEWVGRFTLRVRYKEVDIYLETGDVTIID